MNHLFKHNINMFRPINFQHIKLYLNNTYLLPVGCNIIMQLIILLFELSKCLTAGTKKKTERKNNCMLSLIYPISEKKKH